jgi:hypothetical protein
MLCVEHPKLRGLRKLAPISPPKSAYRQLSGKPLELRLLPLVEPAVTPGWRFRANRRQSGSNPRGHARVGGSGLIGKVDFRGLKPAATPESEFPLLLLKANCG